MATITVPIHDLSRKSTHCQGGILWIGAALGIFVALVLWYAAYSFLTALISGGCVLVLASFIAVECYTHSPHRQASIENQRRLEELNNSVVDEVFNLLFVDHRGERCAAESLCALGWDCDGSIQKGDFWCLHLWDGVLPHGMQRVQFFEARYVPQGATAFLCWGKRARIYTNDEEYGGTPTKGNYGDSCYIMRDK